jgi:hypothetical protein
VSGRTVKEIFFSSQNIFFLQEEETGKEEVDPFEGIDDPTL